MAAVSETNASPFFEIAFSEDEEDAAPRAAEGWYYRMAGAKSAAWVGPFFSEEHATQEADAQPKPALSPWRVIIDPPLYDDACDVGYAWGGLAANYDDAVRIACRECEILNEWEGDNLLDPDDINVIDAEPDYRVILESFRLAVGVALGSVPVATTAHQLLTAALAASEVTK